VSAWKATKPATALYGEPASDIEQLAGGLNVDATEIVSKIQHRESADDYRAVVAILNDRWRIIECRDGIQWILQRRAGERHGRPRWDGRSYCRTKEALIRVCRDYAGEFDPAAAAVLASLPERIDLPDDNRAARWVAGHCRVSVAAARTIAEHAGIGGRCGR
jgi:hypothetical protein